MGPASSSAQREPSMEEILASIRRIIEDSDGGRKVEAPRDEDSAPAASGSGVIEVDAFRAELREPKAAAPQGAPGGENRVVYQPQPRAVETDEESVSPAVEGDPVEPEAVVETDRDAEPPVEEGMDVAAGWQMNGASPVQPARSGIVSEQTGRQVAAAFGELSDAFAASRRRSFDEIAEEMMRPMLQDWLDNNLPTLVERLVREEIERVARGR